MPNENSYVRTRVVHDTVIVTFLVMLAEDGTRRFFRSVPEMAKALEASLYAARRR